MNAEEASALAYSLHDAVDLLSNEVHVTQVYVLQAFVTLDKPLKMI